MELCYFSILLFEGTVKEKVHDKATFNGWLKSHSLFEIKEFPIWIYSVNEVEYHFRLERANYKDWKVYKTEKLKEVYFSFTSNKGVEFINDFEKKLTELLQPPDPLNIGKVNVEQT